MKVLSKILVVLGLVSLTLTVACENKQPEATTDAPAENVGEQPATDKPTEAAPADDAKPAEEGKEEGAAAPTEGEPEAPAASH